MGRKLYCIMKGGCLAAAALISIPASAAKDDPDRADMLQPSTKWQLDYADNSCRLAREFGEGGSRVLIAVEQFGPSDEFIVTLSGRPVAVASRARSAELRFGSMLVNQSKSFLAGDMAEYGRTLLFSGATLTPEVESTPENSENDVVRSALPTIDIDAASKADYIAVHYGNRAVAFNTGELSAPLKALNQCSLDLLTEWGLDAARHKTLTRATFWANRPEIVLELIKAYPRKALWEGRQGMFQMRVLVDENGKMTDCTLVSATVTKNLESPACDAIRKARFEPALDAAGIAMLSYYLTGITYEIAK